MYILNILLGNDCPDNRCFRQSILGALLSLQWRHNEHDGVSNHQPRDNLLNHLIGRRSKKTSELRVTGLCAGNSPWPVISPHKGPVTRKMFPFDDVIMWARYATEKNCMYYMHCLGSYESGPSTYLLSFFEVLPVFRGLFYLPGWTNLSYSLGHV